MKKKLIALLLCVCLISSFCLTPVHAMGAEGFIVGGTAGALGITLSMPQVALLVAAGFGLIYATQHADDIYQGLNTALNNAAGNIENGMEQLTYWKEQAEKGAIALASAPVWIQAIIKEWVSGLYESSVPSTCIAEYAANEPIPTVDFWNSSTKTYNVPVTVIRVGDALISGGYYDIYTAMLVVSTSEFKTGTKYIVNDISYWVEMNSASLTPKADNPLTGSNQRAWDMVSQLPSLEYIKENVEGLSTIRKILNAWASGLLTAGTGSICPDAKVGGIGNVIGEHDIGNVNIPDMDIGDSELLFPPHVLEGNSIDTVLNDILSRLEQQELTWSDYMSDVAVGNPSISIDGKDYVIGNTGVTDIPLEDVLPDNPPSNPPSENVPEGLEPFTISLTDFFPFCIPFDIADFVNVLCAEPEAPRFEWEFPSVDGTTEKLTIDLSLFDDVAQLLRNMELLLFCIGLAMITRNQIRG